MRGVAREATATTALSSLVGFQRGPQSKTQVSLEALQSGKYFHCHDSHGYSVNIYATDYALRWILSQLGLIFTKEKQKKLGS